MKPHLCRRTLLQLKPNWLDLSIPASLIVAYTYYLRFQEIRGISYYWYFFYFASYTLIYVLARLRLVHPILCFILGLTGSFGIAFLWEWPIHFVNWILLNDGQWIWAISQIASFFVFIYTLTTLKINEMYLALFVEIFIIGIIILLNWPNEAIIYRFYQFMWLTGFMASVASIPMKSLKVS